MTSELTKNVLKEAEDTFNLLGSCFTKNQQEELAAKISGLITLYNSGLNPSEDKIEYVSFCRKTGEFNIEFKK